MPIVINQTSAKFPKIDIYAYMQNIPKLTSHFQMLFFHWLPSSTPSSMVRALHRQCFKSAHIPCPFPLLSQNTFFPRHSINTRSNMFCEVKLGKLLKVIIWTSALRRSSFSRFVKKTQFQFQCQVLSPSIFSSASWFRQALEEIKSWYKQALEEIK